MKITEPSVDRACGDDGKGPSTSTTPPVPVAYELADGSVQTYPFGLVTIEFMGEVTAGRVIFGPDDSKPLLGVTALESVGMFIDPAHVGSSCQFQAQRVMLEVMGEGPVDNRAALET